MSQNNKSLDQLDPNYVIIFNYSKDNSAQLLAELSIRGLDAVTRPGPDARSVFVFTRVDTENIKNNDIYSLSQYLPYIIAQFPLYDKETLKRLDKLYKNSMQKQLFSLPTEKELVELALLTGNPNQSLYFAYFKYYIHWSIPLSIIGVFIRITFRRKPSWEFNSLYTFILFFWSTIFISTWIYKSKKHYISLFKGIYKVTLFQSDNGIKKYDERYKVILKKCCFIPIAILFIILSISIQLLCLKLEVIITQLFSGSLKIKLFLLLPSLLNYLLTTTLTKIYRTAFIDKFVKWENGSNPNGSIIEKDFIITFFISYLPLIITLFLYIPHGYVFANEITHRRTTSRFNIFHISPTVSNEFFINIKRFKDQILYYTVTNQIISIAIENLLPFGIHIFKTSKYRTTANTVQDTFHLVYPSLRHYVETHFKEDLRMWDHVNSLHQNDWGPFNYNENMKKLTLQFGYISMFSIIWPLTPFISLIFNLITFKLDLWRSIKKCTPISFPNIKKDSELDDNFKGSISPSDSWNTIMEVILIISSIISPTLTLIYSNSDLINTKQTNIRLTRDEWSCWYPFRHNWNTILGFSVFLEHLAVFIYYLCYKILMASQETPKIGRIPIVSTSQLPKKTNLLDVALQTNNYMQEIANDMKNMRIKILQKNKNDHKDLTSLKGKDTDTTDDIFKITELTPQRSPRNYTQRTPNGHVLRESTPTKKIRSSAKFTKVITSPRIINTYRIPNKTQNIPEQDLYGNIVNETLVDQIPTSMDYHLKNNKEDNGIKPTINGSIKIPSTKLSPPLTDPHSQQTNISAYNKDIFEKEEETLKNPVKVYPKQHNVYVIHNDKDLATKAAATVIKAEREEIPVTPLQLSNKNNKQKRNTKVEPLENISNIRRSLSLRKKSIVSQKSSRAQPSSDVMNDMSPQGTKNTTTNNLHDSSIKQFFRKLKVKL